MCLHFMGCRGCEPENFPTAFLGKSKLNVKFAYLKKNIFLQAYYAAREEVGTDEDVQGETHADREIIERSQPRGAGGTRFGGMASRGMRI